MGKAKLEKCVGAQLEAADGATCRLYNGTAAQLQCKFTGLQARADQVNMFRLPCALTVGRAAVKGHAADAAHVVACGGRRGLLSEEILRCMRNTRPPCTSWAGLCSLS